LGNLAYLEVILETLVVQGKSKINVINFVTRTRSKNHEVR